MPNWAIGTFYAQNPQSGGRIILTISRDGSVTVNMDGSISYASMYKDQLTNNGAVARVTKIRNGIRTTGLGDGASIDYSKNSF